MNYHENFLLYGGERYSIYFHAEAQHSSSVSDYFDNCDDITQASLLFLVKRLGDAGRIYDETKFRIEDKHSKIYCFKPKKERFFCFFFKGRKVIITSAYRKRRQKLDTNELNKAIRICNQYFK